MTQDPEPAADFPRFGVRHLMLWTLFSSVQLVVARWLVSQELKLYAFYDADDQFTQRAMVHLTLGAVVFGAGCTSMLVLIWTRLQRRRPFLSAPGHWLLCSLIFIALYDVLTRSFLLQTSRVPMSLLDYRRQMLISSVGHVPVAILFLWSAIVHRRGGWGWLFGAASLIELGYSVLLAINDISFLWYYALSGFSLLLTMLYVIQTLIESRRGLIRDWAHQVGVYSLLCFALMGTASFLLALIQ